MKFFAIPILLFFYLTSFSQTITTIDKVKTKPGQFNDYIQFLEKNWVVAREKAKAKGYIISFRYETNQQDTLADVILITEYKDSETFSKREMIFQELFREYFPNGAILVNGKRSRDMADIRSSKEIKKTN